LDENVSLATLRQFAIIILPNTAILSSKEVDLLREYVAGNGRLIVSGLSGCCDRFGKVQERSSLESVTGARFVRKLDTLDNWMQFAAIKDSKPSTQFVVEGRPDRAFLVKGPAIACEATTATAIGKL